MTAKHYSASSISGIKYSTGMKAEDGKMGDGKALFSYLYILY